jgi:hypothetical protein
MGGRRLAEDRRRLGSARPDSQKVKLFCCQQQLLAPLQVVNGKMGGLASQRRRYQHAPKKAKAQQQQAQQQQAQQQPGQQWPQQPQILPVGAYQQSSQPPPLTQPSPFSTSTQSVGNGDAEAAWSRVTGGACR